MDTTLKLNSVVFSYGQETVLKEISLTIKTGQIGCLLGPSGCGKSTLLRLVAGFEKPQTGEIYVENKMVADPHHSSPPQNRQVGMLFQDLALFPHLTTTENIAFGLHQLNKDQQQHRVQQLLTLCRLEGLQSRYPHQLSGGQSQRVALARAMAPKPKLILLDEPFSSVDSGLQSELVHEVKTMLKADDSTALWVTHSLNEAFAVADQIGVMLDGSLLQWASPTDLYEKPHHPDVVRFLNHANLITGVITAKGNLDTEIKTFKLSNSDMFKEGQKAQVAIPKKQLSVNDSGHKNAVVTACTYQGGSYAITSKLVDDTLIKHNSDLPLAINTEVCIQSHVNQAIKGLSIKNKQ